MDKTLLTFYGFGNYLAGGERLGAKMVFLFATDKETAAKMLVKVVGSEGKVVTASLKIVSGTTILLDWLLAAAMESQEANWSSGLSVSSITTLSATPKEHLN